MELADPQVLASLLVSAQKPRIDATRLETAATLVGARAPKIRRCQCGHCPNCIDNARWDRIFNAKFADRTYYNPKPLHFGSSLGWLTK